jgi:hypothetical protein
MATIERKPLPPPNSTATSITEADRAEMMAQANAVIDYYLNGPGSYWDAGPRKPLVGDERDDSTVNDLKKFKERVIASKQFADDPNSILDSVIDLIDQATMQIKKVAQNRYGRDDIQRAPPSTNDQIEYPKQLPRIPGSTVPPISLRGGQSVPSPQTRGIPANAQSTTSGQEPTGPQMVESIRVLGRFAPDGTRLDSYPPLKPGLQQPQTDKRLGRITGQPDASLRQRFWPA